MLSGCLTEKDKWICMIEKRQLNFIPDEIDNMSSLKWYNTSNCCTSMLLSLKGLMHMCCVQQNILFFIWHRFTVYFSRYTKPVQMEQVSAYLKNKVCTLAACKTLYNREPLVPEGITAAEMWHKATKCPGLKNLVGVTVEQAFNMQLLNSDPYKHTGTDNLPEMYITCRAPGKLPHVQCSLT